MTVGNQHGRDTDFGRLNRVYCRVIFLACKLKMSTKQTIANL